MHRIPLPRAVKARSRHTLMSAAVAVLATASYLGVAAGDVEALWERTAAVADEPVEEDRFGDAPEIYGSAAAEVKSDGRVAAAAELSTCLGDTMTAAADEDRSLEARAV